MANAATPERSPWLATSLLIVGAITAARVVALAFVQADLFVDEAQYWFWGQELALGYYSKPPMIGWLIRAVTDLAGSDEAFWIRLPAPLLHGATALILGSIAARLFDARAAVVTAAGYVTLPMVSLASILMSTDTVMFPFLALALAGYLRLLEDGAGARIAILTGVALGLAFLSKYAAIYYLICAPIAAAAIPAARIKPRLALAVLLAFFVVISPNILWNIQNGLTTVQHTMDNADWVRDPGGRAELNTAGLAEFFGAQFAVVGPVVFGGLLWLLFTCRQRGPRIGVLLAFSVPIIMLVCIQALLSKAYANWAAAAYLAATIAVLPMLSRPWLATSFLINGALAVALPIAGMFAERFTIGDRLALARYVGRDEMSLQIMEIAENAGIDTIVARNRDILADLFHTARESGLTIYAVPPEGRAPNHYAQTHPFPGATSGRVLFVSDNPAPPPCDPSAKPLAVVSPASGAYRGKDKTLFVVPADCWRLR